MKADAETEAAVMSVLNRLAEGYAKRDLDGVLSIFAPDPDTVMFGTGADEKRLGLAEIKSQVERDWSQSEATSLTYEWTSISSAGAVAWVAADVTFGIKAGGQQLTFPARMTCVLEKRGDHLLFVQGHFSFPAAGEAEGESFPT